MWTITAKASRHPEVCNQLVCPGSIPGSNPFTSALMFGNCFLDKFSGSAARGRTDYDHLNVTARSEFVEFDHAKGESIHHAIVLI